MDLTRRTEHRAPSAGVPSDRAELLRELLVAARARPDRRRGRETSRECDRWRFEASRDAGRRRMSGKGHSRTHRLTGCLRVTADGILAVSGKRVRHNAVGPPYDCGRAGWYGSEKMNDVQVFLSHASADKPLAEVVRAQLQECGFTVWSDEPSRPGDSVAELIVSGINSSDAFVVILGESTTARQWTSLEIGGAVASGRPIVPVLAHRDASVPFLLRDVQYLDLSDPAARREQLPRLCDALREEPARLGAASGRRLIEDASEALQSETFVYEEALAASEHRDRRSQLLAALLSVVAVAVALVTVSSDVTSLMSALVAGLSALVASMVGFYFGAERNHGGRD